MVAKKFGISPTILQSKIIAWITVAAVSAGSMTGALTALRRSGQAEMMLNLIDKTLSIGRY